MKEAADTKEVTDSKVCKIQKKQKERNRQSKELN
jgi:hypothetical protein